MGGAILPMAVAWQIARRMARPYAGQAFPVPNRSIDRKLVIGSVLFGIGWGLVGLCPGPAVASLTYGGTSGAVFLIAMLIGMGAAPKLRSWLDRSVPAD